MKFSLQVFIFPIALLTCWGLPTQAQPIQSTADGTGTQVTSPQGNSNQFDIGGGTRAGANLFHSFEKFGLSRGQIANVLSNPSIRNILGRVVGGDVSRINGLVQVVGGNSNLFLMNPAGFVFGPNSTLNVPASFTATTANGIQVGDYWFDALGKNNYSQLVGQPNGFAFVSDQPGSLVNAGNLTVPRGEHITLVGGLVINTGTLEAPEGKVTIASVPHKQLVKISQEGSLLSLGLPTAAESQLLSGMEGFTPLALPELLTGGDQPRATGVVADSQGVRLTGSDIDLPTDPGTTIVAGTVDVSGAEGGTVHVLGDKVGLLGGTIDASGEFGGGTALIGGDYKGQSVVPNASRTVIDEASVIRADALTNGDGGRVIAWADGTTGFYGDISSTGGANAGDGGFVEVSGSRFLDFQGSVDTSAPNGNFGTLLIDPTNIEVVNTDADTFTLNSLDDPETTGNVKLDKQVIEYALTDVTLAASNDIIFNTPLEIQNSIELIAIAGNNININSPITAVKGLDIGLTLNASNSITIDGPIGSVDGAPTDDGFVFGISRVELESVNDININEKIDSRKILNLTSTNGNIFINGSNSQPIIGIGVQVPNQQFEEFFDFSTSEFNFQNASAEFTAKGDVLLVGGILLEESSTLKIEAQHFRAIMPVTSDVINANPGGDAVFVERTVDFNIGVATYRNPSASVNKISTPNVKLEVKFTDVSGQQPKPMFSGSETDQPDASVEILLSDGSSFVFGENFTPEASNSGMEAPIQILQIQNTVGSVIDSSSTNFETGSFTASLVNPTDDPNTGGSNPDNNPGSSDNPIADNPSNPGDSGGSDNPSTGNPEPDTPSSGEPGLNNPSSDGSGSDNSGSPGVPSGDSNSDNNPVSPDNPIADNSDPPGSSGSDNLDTSNPGSDTPSSSDSGPNNSGSNGSSSDNSGASNSDNSGSSSNSASDNLNSDTPSSETSESEAEDTQNAQEISDQGEDQGSSNEPEGGAALDEEEEIASNCQLVNGNQVKCSQPNQILTYQFTPQVDVEGKPILDVEPEQLPELLTGRDTLGFNLHKETPADLVWQFPTDAQSSPFKLTISQIDLKSSQ